MTALAAHTTGSRHARRSAVLLATACLLAVAALTPACSDEDARRSIPSDDGRITVAIPGADDAIEPLRFILTQTRLIRLDQSGLEQPAVIERWTQSADNRTWTLFVRDGVRLHDGRVATAADVVSRVKEALKPSVSRPGLWPVVSVEDTGPREVRLELREPSSFLLEALSVVQAVPAGPYRSPNDEATEPEFQAVSQPGQPTGQVKAIKVRRYDTARGAVAALLRDDVDVLYEVPPDSRALLIGEEGVRVFPNVKPYVVTLGFNHKHPVLRKRDVRLAMNIAIDRRVLVAQVAGGIGVPAADMIWHQHWSRPHEDDLRAFPMDRQRAGQLLDGAGLPRRTTDAGAIEPRFRVSCLVLDDPVIQRMAARLQKAYADVGISLDLQPTALDELGGRLATGRFDAFIAPVVSGYGMSMPYGHFGSHSHPRMIAHGYTAAGPAAERVRSATSREELRQAVHGLHRVLMDDPPAVYLFWQETSRAVGRRVSVPADASGDVLNALARWSIRSPMP